LETVPRTDRRVKWQRDYDLSAKHKKNIGDGDPENVKRNALSVNDPVRD
jgi:hypothetical protein